MEIVAFKEKSPALLCPSLVDPKHLYIPSGFRRRSQLYHGGEAKMVVAMALVADCISCPARPDSCGRTLTAALAFASQLQVDKFLIEAACIRI